MHACESAKGSTGSSAPLFAAIHLPGFALQAATCLEHSLAGRALVLMEECGRKAVVAALNSRAHEAGVTVGMTAPQALARCPEAVVRGRSAEKEKLAGESLLAAAFTFSPRVEETEEGLCTVDLKGAPGLHDSARMLRHSHRMVGELRTLGLEAKIGFGRNPLLAYFAARRANPVLEVDDEIPFLAGLPLSIAEPSPQIAAVLEQWGVRTLGVLVALPRHEIAKRLGEEGIAFWDRAAGRQERVLKLAQLPEEFVQTMELEHEMETLEPLLFILRRFIGQLSLRLSAVYKVAEEVKLELNLTDDSTYERVFRLPEPTRDPELLFRMMHTHLDGVRTEFPIVKIHLSMKPCQPSSKQQDLFEAAVKDAYSFADTLARLVAVVGSGNVGSPRLEPTHRPDTFRLVPLADIRQGAEPQAEQEAEPDPEEKDGGGRIPPMRRYRPPLAARVWLESERPTYVESTVVNTRIRQARGPWRLSGNWWDQHRWARDEWDVECANGGSYRLARVGKSWFLEGEYG